MLEFFYWLHLRVRKIKKLSGIVYILCSWVTNIFYYLYYKLFYRYFRKCGVTEKKQVTNELIISLTTFPARINEVCICIETIMRQTIKPNRIFLWLASSQFESFDSLPPHLLYLQSRGLEIKFCDDLRSHKKYFYTIRDNHDSIVITLDDDVYYPRYTLKRLVDSYKKNPRCISCNIAKRIRIVDNIIQPYNTWLLVNSKLSKKSINIAPIGVGGVLYHPEALSKDVFNIDYIKALCIHTDDLWLKTMSLLKGTKVVYTGEYPTLFCIGKSQKENLGKINCIENRNDSELQNIIKKFPNAWSNGYEGYSKTKKKGGLS